MPKEFEKFAHPNNAAAVTPNDSTNLTNQGVLYVGGDGDVSVVTASGQTVTFVGVVAGSFIPVRVSRVRSTGTTATDIIVLY